jgi:hypothetical protein
MFTNAIYHSISRDDVDTAKKIRDHYEQRFMVARLANESLGGYHEKMLILLHTNQYEIHESHIKILYKLPEFYEYDMELIKLTSHLNNYVTRKLPYSKEIELKLSYVGKIYRSTRMGKYYDYWFSNEHGEPVKIPVEKSNILCSWWDHVSKELKVRAAVRERDGIYNVVPHLEIRSFEIIP